MLVLRQAPLWRPHPTSQVVSQAIEPPPDGGDDFIPADATWWIKGSLISDATIASWTANAASRSKPTDGHYAIHLSNDGCKGGWRLKNAAVKPRPVGKLGGAWKGALRVRRGPAQQDPTGTGVADVADWGGINPAHCHASAIDGAGNEILYPYGTRCEYGAVLMIPDGTTPDDSDVTQFYDPKCTWLIGLGLAHSSSADTVESPCVRFSLAATGKGLLCCTGWVDPHENIDMWGPMAPNGTIGARIANFRGGSWNASPNNTHKLNWEAATPIPIKMVFMLTPASETSWCDFYLFDMARPWAIARNFRGGTVGKSQSAPFRFGHYSGDPGGYSAPSSSRTIWYDQCYIKKGGSTTAPVWT